MKDLIKDILTYLKENDEARERFNKISTIKCCIYKDNILFDDSKLKSNISPIVYQEYEFISKSKKLAFLIHALSSPNGKPICGFLEEECNYPNCKDGHYPLCDDNGDIDWGGCPQCVKDGGRIYPINHASTIFNLLTKQIEKGKSFDEILIKLNEKYNELCK